MAKENIKESEGSVSSSRLMQMLADEAIRRGDKPKDLAVALGISYMYMLMLMRGARNPNGMSRQSLVACSKYLDVPVAQAFMWAGVLEAEDFVHKSKFQSQSTDIYEIMARQPDVGAFMPDEDVWNALPFSAKLAMATLFEQATRVKVTDKIKF